MTENNPLKSYFNLLADEIEVRGKLSKCLHRPDSGGNKEDILINILNSHLPDCLEAINGGMIINKDNETSGQIDIIIKNNLFPKFSYHEKNYILTENVVAVISVKSQLDKSSLNEAIENIANIPKYSSETLSLTNLPINNANEHNRFYQNWPYRIIFAYDGIETDTLYKHTLSYYNLHPTRHLSFPKLIVINKKSCLQYFPNGCEFSPPGKKWLNPVKLKEDTQGYPISWMLSEIQNYLSFINKIKFEFGPYGSSMYLP